MSGPKKFRVRVTPTFQERLAERQRQRIDAVRSETDRLLAEMRSIVSRSGVGVAPREQADLVKKMVESARAVAAQTRQPAVVVAVEEVAQVMASGVPANEVVLASVESARQHVQRAAETEIAAAPLRARQEAVAQEVREVLVEMGFAVMSEVRPPAPGIDSAPLLVAARGSEQVAVDVGAEVVMTNWSENAGSDCISGLAVLSSRLLSRGVEIERQGRVEWVEQNRVKIDESDEGLHTRSA